jgi:putative flavoprotein involved in K+ transport
MTDIPASNAALDGRHHAVAVIGGGQAGLSMSWHLTQRHIDHVVLERNSLAHEWQASRWDTFCLVTPNWQCQLPGYGYSGNDPDGFMVRDEIVQYLRSYRESFDPPLHEGVGVNALTRVRSHLPDDKGVLAGAPGLRPDRGPFRLETSAGTVTADQVVVATGGYHDISLPRLAERLPAHVAQLHSSQYRNPDSLPGGEVLVVGSGQSGAQIAEDLHLAGRQVHLAVGSAPRVARFYRGRDVVAWLDDMGYYDMAVTGHSQQEKVRHNANHYVTGRDGGRDIDLRRFAAEGMRLYGRLTDVGPEGLQFGDDLAAHLDRADDVSESIKDSIDKHIATQGIDAPIEERYIRVWQPGEHHPRSLALERVGTVIWCTGFRSNYRWIELPLFDGAGYPTHVRGVTQEPGLYFLGLPWQWTWGSGRFSGVAADADYLIRVISRRVVADRSRLDGRRADQSPASNPHLNPLALGS